MISAKTAAWVLACVVLPVAWGALIHWLFQRLRGRRPSERSSADHWQDYQI